MNTYEIQMANREVITVDYALERIALYGLANVGDCWVLMQRPNRGEVDPVDATQVQRYLDIGWTRPLVTNEEAVAELVPELPEPGPEIIVVERQYGRTTMLGITPALASEPKPVKPKPAVRSRRRAV